MFNFVCENAEILSIVRCCYGHYNIMLQNILTISGLLIPVHSFISFPQWTSCARIVQREIV